MADVQVGVLVVHGIGTQTKGSELRAWLNAVVAYLRGGPAPVPVHDIVPIDAVPGDPVTVHTPPLPHAQGARQCWLVGEAWWAEVFPVPDRRRVSRWLVDIGPWFVYLFVVRLWRRFHVDRLALGIGLAFAVSVALLLRGAVRGEPSTGAIIGFGVSAAATVLSAAIRDKRRASALLVTVTFVVLLPLASIATVAVIVLWLAGMVPGKPGAKVRAFQLTVARSIGDVYALVADPVAEQQMFAVITDAARTVAGGEATRPIVIVAHSQGAALAYRAINGHQPLRDVLATRPVTLVTYGGAILPVHLLERRLRCRRPVLDIVQGLAGLLGMLLMAFVAVRVATNVVDAWVAGAAMASLVLTTGVGLHTWRQAKVLWSVRAGASIVAADTALDANGETAFAVRLRRPGTKPMRWVDLWAPWDPVPNGPLDLAQPYWSTDRDAPLNAPQDTFFSVPVANHHQPWFDHVVYRAAHEDVVSRWVGEIAARAVPGTTPRSLEDPPGVSTTEAARRARRWLGWALLGMQAVIAVATVAAVAWRWEALDELGRWVARRVPVRDSVDRGIELVPSWLRNPVFGAGRQPAHLHGLVAAVAAVASMTAISAAIVGAFRAAATAEYLRHSAMRGVTRTAWLVASAVGLAAPLVLIILAASANAPSVPLRSFTVHPATAGGIHLTGSATVIFDPIGDNGEADVEVEIDGESLSVELPGDTAYAVTASADAGEECTPTVVGLTVYVACKALPMVEAAP